MWFVKHEGLGYLIWIQIDIVACNDIAHRDLGSSHHLRCINLC